MFAGCLPLYTSRLLYFDGEEYFPAMEIMDMNSIGKNYRTQIRVCLSEKVPVFSRQHNRIGVGIGPITP